MNFSEKLKLVRKEKQITQEELAELLSVSRQAVSKWESGAGYPETEKLLVISKELNISLDYLLLDENEIEQKGTEDPKKIIYSTNGKIAIQTSDKKNIVLCHSVKSSNIFAPGKDEPKYILSGVEQVTFWGEHTTILGWYESLDGIEKEIVEITAAIREGKATYELQYAVDIEYVGFFGQPKVKK
jgi:transcriptional regulator with XRE-family HTH domain